MRSPGPDQSREAAATMRMRPARPTADEVHVWRIPLDRAPAPADWRRELSPDEAARADHLAETAIRDRFIAGRVMLRRLLGAYLGEEPGRVPLGERPGGKPELIARDEPLRFNMSHSDGLALAAFTTGVEVGIDVERVREDARPEVLAARFLPPAERDCVLGAPPGLRAAAFFRCWTRKEACLKGVGLGFALGLGSFAIGPEAPPPVRVEIRPPGASTEIWWVHDLDVDPGWAGALAVGHPGLVPVWHNLAPA